LTRYAASYIGKTRLTTHSTGAEIAYLSSDKLKAWFGVSRPVNSGVGPLRIHKTVEMNGIEIIEQVLRLNHATKGAAQQFIEPEPMELDSHSTT
jgi:hypothetical protein